MSPVPIRAKWAAILGIIVLCACIALDLAVSAWQARRFAAANGPGDYLAQLASRVSPGMPRRDAETTIAGFRDWHQEPQIDTGSIVAYRYWFGFIPPLCRFGVKLAGEVVIRYDNESRVVEVTSWTN